MDDCQHATMFGAFYHMAALTLTEDVSHEATAGNSYGVKAFCQSEVRPAVNGLVAKLK